MTLVTAPIELLLVGAGHAHLYVVAHAAELVTAGYRVTLLAPATFDYSGLASASAAGVVPRDAGQIDVAALARRAGVRQHVDTLASLDHDRRLAVTADGAELSYDVVSFNIGSVVDPVGMSVGPDVVRVKPLSSLTGLGERLAAAGGSGARVSVVGGGATGLELAAHLAAHPAVGEVCVLEAGPVLGADLPHGARRRIQRLLSDRDVEVHTDCAVAELGAESLRGADGSARHHDVAVLATGLAAPPLLADLGLGDRDGVPVRATLQHRDHETLYAAGDCAHFLPRPLPRIGVHGVRQGPVLLRSLLARQRGEPLPEYRPQRRALAVLDLGAGVGLATWGRAWWFGRSALRLKRWIDRRWLRGYRAD